jgi:hypothetical protein
MRAYNPAITQDIKSNHLSISRKTVYDGCRGVPKQVEANKENVKEKTTQDLFP